MKKPKLERRFSRNRIVLRNGEYPVIEWIYSLVTEEVDRRGLFKVLDIGCGRGHLAYRLHEHGHDVWLCDVKDIVCDNYKIFKEKKRFLEVDFNETLRLPYPDNSFDFVTCTEVLEHLQNPRRVIEDCYRILKPGGKLLVSIPHITSLHKRLYFLLTGKILGFDGQLSRYGHKTLLTEDMLKQQFEYTGLVVDWMTISRSFIPILRWQFFPTWTFGNNVVICGRKEEKS